MSLAQTKHRDASEAVISFGSEGPISLASLLGTFRIGLDAMKGSGSLAAVSRVRGTGPGASFSGLIETISHQHPLHMQRPFEGCESIAGGVWEGRALVSPEDPDALLVLRFDPDARDLPVHQHALSDRLIVVLEGRGFFHVTGEAPGEFDRQDVRTTAVRERDVIAFRSGVLHTFSTAQHGMTLLSFHRPYVPLEDEGQYAIPPRRWTAREHLPLDAGEVVLEPSWRQLVWPPASRS